MNRPHEVVGLGGDDGVGFDRRGLLALPMLPEPGEAERPPVLAADQKRLFPPIRPLGPLIKAVAYDDASPDQERLAERWFLGYGFRPCVDEPIADRRIVRPGRHQPPAQEI